MAIIHLKLDLLNLQITYQVVEVPQQLGLIQRIECCTCLEVMQSWVPGKVQLLLICNYLISIAVNSRENSSFHTLCNVKFRWSFNLQTQNWRLIAGNISGNVFSVASYPGAPFNPSYYPGGRRWWHDTKISSKIDHLQMKKKKGLLDGLILFFFNSICMEDKQLLIWTPYNQSATKLTQICGDLILGQNNGNIWL